MEITAIGINLQGYHRFLNAVLRVQQVVLNVLGH
jgi:hypothetical protein